MKRFWTVLSSYFDWFYVPHITVSDILEIIILSYLIYTLIMWVKKTRAWTVFRGIIVIAVFMGFAAVFKLNTILWLFRNLINVGILAVVILFQPELRRALEELGKKNIISEVLIRNDSIKSDRVNDNTIQELISAATFMSKNKTGALVVIEQNVPLGEYEATGINIDAAVSRQLVENIFEHNTPLHDGAVIIRNNRVVAATCYLPLTGRNDLNKDLGTRHRAAVGISEVSDSMTLVVSEENGQISIAYGGVLYENLDVESLRTRLTSLQSSKSSQNKKTRKAKRIKGGKKK
ncbi:MAG: diadenylate cyclase CdaA [Lachnospiraceae bacterium]|nr:diadenylate cyclase CdaA [Lachnospiraceae bacterium]